MRHVTDHHHLAGFRKQAVGDPRWRVVRQQPARGGELRERIARVPVRVGGLARAQLAAVPDDVRLRVTCSRFACQFLHLLLSPGRERPHRVLVGSHGVAVVRDVQPQAQVAAHELTSGRCRRREC